MKAFKKEDKIALDTLINNMKKDLDKASYLVTYSNEAFCSGATRDDISPSMLVETEIMIYQLKALRTWLDMDTEQTEDHLKKTIALEEGLSYSYGPPVIQKPTHELYAEWLMQQNRKEEALEQYKMTLEKAPKRKKAMEGLALAEKV
jgi:hypothetical protein